MPPPPPPTAAGWPSRAAPCGVNTALASTSNTYAMPACFYFRLDQNACRLSTPFHMLPWLPFATAHTRARSTLLTLACKCGVFPRVTRCATACTLTAYMSTGTYAAWHSQCQRGRFRAVLLRCTTRSSRAGAQGRSQVWWAGSPLPCRSCEVVHAPGIHDRAVLATLERGHGDVYEPTVAHGRATAQDDSLRPANPQGLRSALKPAPTLAPVAQDCARARRYSQLLLPTVL